MKVIGYACGLAAKDTGCADGPEGFDVSECLKPKHFTDKYDAIAEICTRLAEITRKEKRFAVIGGDHSSAIGTWSGVADALEGDLGLLWIDAHLDAHTPQTTLSGNIHGMPVASLLGLGDKRLSTILNEHPKIEPEHLCIIGARSFESAEQELINKLDIRVYYMDEINTRGLATVFEEAKKIVTKNTKAYGITLDLDAIDPIEAPGVGTPAESGLHAKELIEMIKKYGQDAIGLEIAEFNPHHDKHKKTDKIVRELLNAWEFRS